MSDLRARLSVRLGELLARRRVPLGFAAGTLVLWLAHPTVPLLVTGCLIAWVGEGLRIWAAGHLRKAHELTSSGPYQITGHPLYLGSAIMGIGLVVASGSLAAAALIASYLTATITASIGREDRFLRSKFGDEYAEYRRRKLDARAAEGTRRFSLAQAMANREHRAIAGLVVAVLLLLWKATYNGAFRGAAAGPP